MGGRIENPYAQTLISYTLNDQGQSRFETKLPSLDTAQHMAAVLVGIIFTYIDRRLEKIEKPESLIERPG